MAVLRLYFDDTGSRHPDKRPDPTRKGRDWFGLGGFVIRKEDESAAKQLHTDLAQRWGVRAPFHMTDMLAEKKGFSWLGRVSESENERFWSEYKTFLASVNGLGMACVIDRPGYVARGYLEQHGANRWLLCRTAFDVLVERCAKYARLDGRKLEIVFESDVGVNDTIKGYFRNLKENGLAFDKENSAKYNPLSKEEFKETLATIESKGKSSQMLQIADSYIYAMARGRYDRKFQIYRRLRDAQRLSTFALPNEHISEMGIKYSCFEKHDAK